MADFLDRVKQGLGKGMTTISVKSKEMMDANRVRSQIAALEQQKKDALTDIGQAVCSMLDANRIDQATLKSKRAAVSSLDEQIKQKQAELELIHAQAQESLSAHGSGTVCTCGAQLAEGGHFCASCGRKIGAAGAGS